MEPIGTPAARERRPSAGLTRPPSPADRLAHGVAYVLNPLVLPPILFGSVLMQFGAPPVEVGAVTASSLLLLTVLPVLLLGWMVRGGRAASFESFNREQRNLPYVFGIGCAAAALSGLIYLVDTARPVVVAVGVCVVLGAVLLALINLRWKISIHSAAAGGFAAALGFTAYLSGTADEPMTMVLLVILVPLVMWARVRTRSHTVGEVLAGAAFGIIVPLAELFALLQLGVLHPL